MRMTTLAQATRELAAIRGARPITIMARTELKLNKKSRETGERNPFGKIYKIARVNGFINYIYENSVNNQRGREDKPQDFVAMPRVWGTHVPNTPFIEHNDKLYLHFKVERSLDVILVDEDGIIRSWEELSEWLPARSVSCRQGVDEQVIARAYNMTNVKAIMMNNETLVVG